MINLRGSFAGQIDNFIQQPADVTTRQPHQGADVGDAGEWLADTIASPCDLVASPCDLMASPGDFGCATP